MPALALSEESRRRAFRAALAYYGAALWPLIPNAQNFFGPDVPALAGIGLWAVGAILLASPWLLVWSPHREQAIWRAPAGITLTVVPPLGIIGWASPLTAAGILFPGAAWYGLLFCAVSTGALVFWPRQTAATLAALSLAFHIAFRDARRLSRWEAVDTAFGGIAHGDKSLIAEYQAAQWIQAKALTATADVLIFPETVVPAWTPATDAFWKPTLDRLRSSGKTILVGARVPTPALHAARAPYDFSADLTALGSVRPQVLSMMNSKVRPATEPGFPYDNVVIVRGAQTGVFKQRIPVPIAMWNPLVTTAARLNLSSPGVVNIDGERAAILICYEQLLTWPPLISMAQRPTVLIAIANDHLATGAAIPRFQLAAVRAWARLFRLPYLSAVNK